MRLLAAIAIAGIIPTIATAQTLPLPTFKGAVISGSPSIVTCPAANCPNPVNGTGNAVLSSQYLTGSTAKDAGTAEWLGVDGLYINTGQPNGQKVTRYIGAVQGALGGSSWALNTDIVRNGVPNGPNGQVGSSSPGTAGAIPNANSTVGYELDFTNWDKDCPAGGCFAVGMYVHNQSLFPSLAGVYYDSQPQNAGNNNYAWHNGIFFSGAFTAKDNTVLDATNSTFSYQVTGSHTVGFYENSTSAYGLQVNGAHTTADIWLSDNAPTGILIQGTHSSAGVADSSTGPTSLNVSGTHTFADASFATNSPVVINVTGAHSFETFNDQSTGPASLNITGTHTFADVVVSTSSPTAFKISGAQSSETILDASTSPVGLHTTGTHTSADMALASNSPKAIDITGTRATASFTDASTTPAALNLTGTYSLAAINMQASSATNAILTKAGQNICFNASTVCFHYDSGTGKVFLTNSSSVNIMSIDMSGNVIFKGTMTGSATP